MPRIPKHIVDQIYQATDILDVVGDYLSLKKKGQNYMALSPFKKEKTPSFSVSPSKNIFKDFSSGLGGNAVNFLMEIEGYSYYEALLHLARKYNIEIPTGTEDPAEAGNRQARERLLELNKFAARWFRKQLLENPEGQQRALPYLQERGYTHETLNLFQIGYSPQSWEAFSKYAQKHQYSLEDLLEVGLVVRSEKTNRPYDRFRGRVIFPLHDLAGNIIGFAGRILDTTARAAKYVNSPESALYDKSSFLYGLYFAKLALREAGRLYMVEGYTDVMSLYQAGIKNVVASSGTSLTEAQVNLVKRFTNQVTVLFDGDTAGQKAGVRGLQILLAKGLQVRVLPLPVGEDPDSFVREKGAKGFKAFAQENSLDFIDFLIQVITADQDPEDPQVQTAVVNEVSDAIARIPEEVQRAVYVRHAAKKLQLPEDLIAGAVQRIVATQQRQTELRQRFQQKKAKGSGGLLAQRDPGSVNKHQAPAETLPKQPPLYPQEKELVRIMLNHYHYEVPLAAEERPDEQAPETVRLMDYVVEDLEAYVFFAPELETIRRAVIDAHKAGNELPLRFLIQQSEPEVKRLTLKLMEPPQEELSRHWEQADLPIRSMDQHPYEVYNDALLHYRYQRVQLLIEENRQKLKGTSDNEELMKLLTIQKNLEAVRKEITDALGIVTPPGPGRRNAT